MPVLRRSDDRRARQDRTLIGLGLVFFLRPGALLLAYVIGALMFVTILTAAIQDMFGTGGHAGAPTVNRISGGLYAR
jgi:hypothetical protein